MSGEIERIQSVYSKRSSFDPKYSFFNSGQLFISQERERDLLKTLKESGVLDLRGLSILEVGCGTGIGVLDWIRWGADANSLSGVDILKDRLDIAKCRLPNSCRIIEASADKLPFANETFDIVIQSTVFSSILDDTLQMKISQEMSRVLKSNGIIIWYDFCFNSPRNPDVRGVSQVRVKELFPQCSINGFKTGTLSPLVRVLAPISQGLCYLASWLPFLKTHYVAVLRKKK